MKDLFKYLMLIVLAVSISTAFTSCGGDEPDNPNEPDTPVVTPPADDDDPAKYDIVGKWKMEKGSTTVVFEIDRSGYLLCTETYNGNTNDYNGKWTYDTSKKQWRISFVEWNGYGGSYHMVGDKLISGTNIFYKYTEDEDQPTQSGQLAGTNWVTTYDNRSFELSFNNDGTYSETWEGDYNTGPIKYYELADNTVIFETGGVLYNTLGWDPIPFELNADKTKLTLKGRYETFSFTRKR